MLLDATPRRPDYLKACALVRKGRAEETCDDAHDCVGYITLQRGVRMLPVTGIVAHLSKDGEYISIAHSHWIALPSVWAIGERRPTVLPLIYRTGQRLAGVVC